MKNRHLCVSLKMKILEHIIILNHFIEFSIPYSFFIELKFLFCK